MGLWCIYQVQLRSENQKLFGRRTNTCEEAEMSQNFSWRRIGIWYEVSLMNVFITSESGMNTDIGWEEAEGLKGSLSLMGKRKARRQFIKNEFGSDA